MSGAVGKARVVCAKQRHSGVGHGLSIRDIELANKHVFIRVDFNVPLTEDGQTITDDTRIIATLPTIEYALRHKAKVILASHLGRPKGKPNPEMSMKPVAKKLGELLGKPVKLAPDCVGPDVEAMLPSPGEVVLLENLRYHADAVPGAVAGR